MLPARLFCISLSLCGALITQSTSAITIDTVPVGNPGNANDPATGSLYGGITYNYRIGKYDVTIGQYTDFLNAIAATDTYSLYNSAMANDLNIAGIARAGTSGSYSYSVIGSPNHPITYVSWGDAARFANWVDNGQPTGDQGAGTTETGAYMLDGAATNEGLNAVSRSAGAKWFIPSESEWYKAAYYDPAAGHYWSYATGTDTTPTSAPASDSPNSANYFDFTATGYALTHTKSYDPNQNYLTDVGAYTASASPNGTFDQSGLVYQWNEGFVGGPEGTLPYRGLRGGSWADDGPPLRATYRYDSRPMNELADVGFRLATIVPEPSTAALAAMAGGVMVLARKQSMT